MFRLPKIKGSSMGRHFKNFGYLSIGLLFSLAMLEGLLRLVGKEPYHATETVIESQPDWSLCPHSTLGIGLQPGTFEVSINGGLQYTCTHQKDSTRRTQLPSDSTANDRKKLALFGCSFTYGMGLNDSATFAYQMQQALPDWRVYNYGVPAYGTVQSLLQFQQQIATGEAPALVLLNYSALHNARNKLSPAQQKYWSEALQKVYAQNDDFFATANFPYLRRWQQPTLDIQHLNIQEMQKRWNWSYHSAAAYAFEVVIDHIWDGFCPKHKVSEKIILSFAALCRAQQIPFVLTGITNDPATLAMLDICQSQGIATLDLGVDIRHPDFNLQPYDSHPNERANRQYAQQIVAYLQTK